MLTKLKQSKGFTIIEVMIVLAIAGLIILIVLLAVPALQRSSRNTAIKNDASAVAAGISEYESNNDGLPPVSITTAAGGVVTICDASPCSATVTKATAKVQGGTQVSAVATAVGTTVPGAGTVVVHRTFRCDGTSSPRSVAIAYPLETSATSTLKCIDS